MKISDSGGHESVDQDSRGILHPWLMQQRVKLTRYPPTPALEGIVDRFWAVGWRLPVGADHQQQVLTHPCANLTVGPPDGKSSQAGIEARLYGVARTLTTRQLRGEGWTVAAMTTVGGLGALSDAPASRWTDRSVPLGETLHLDADQLVNQVVAAPDEPRRVAALADALESALLPDRVAAARSVSGLARMAEGDPGLVRVGDLAAAAGLSQRSVQRMFLRYAGVSPAWVLRRYRLLEAAEAVRRAEQVDWAKLAARLGYADQAHLIRDFRAAVGQTPAAYARSRD